MKLTTSLIIPAYNEEEGLPLTIKEYYPYVDEIIIVDDGSIDSTCSHAMGTKMLIDDNLPQGVLSKITLCYHESNLGKVQSIQSGIVQATKDIIILTDADFTYPAEYIPTMLEAINNDTDLVIGSRFMHNVNNMSWLNKIGNKAFALITSYIGCTNITDPTSGLRAFKRSNFNKLNVDAKGLEWEAKMTLNALKQGFKVKEIPIHYRKRVGKSKLNPIKDGFKMLKALLHVTFTEIPLIVKVTMYSSVIMLLGASYFGIVALQEMYKWMTYGTDSQHKYYPLLSAFLVLLSIQIFTGAIFFNYVTTKLNKIEEKL